MGWLGYGSTASSSVAARAERWSVAAVDAADTRNMASNQRSKKRLLLIEVPMASVITRPYCSGRLERIMSAVEME